MSWTEREDRCSGAPGSTTSRRRSRDIETVFRDIDSWAGWPRQTNSHSRPACCFACLCLPIVFQFVDGLFFMRLHLREKRVSNFTDVDHKEREVSKVACHSQSIGGIFHIWCFISRFLLMDFHPLCFTYGVLPMVFYLWCSTQGVLHMVFYSWCSTSDIPAGVYHSFRSFRKLKLLSKNQ